VEQDEQGFGLLETAFILLIIGIIGFTGWFVWIRLSASSEYPSTNQSLAFANTIGATLYTPQPVPTGYMWDAMEILNSHIDQINKSNGAGQMGKYLPANHSALEIQYVSNYDQQYRSYNDLTNLFETKSVGNFDPSTDCVGPGTVNIALLCSQAVTLNGRTIYYNDQNADAFTEIGSTFIYLSYNNLPDLVEFVTNLRPVSVTELRVPLSQGQNPEVVKNLSSGESSNPF
jgi:hypothetical protein